MLHTGVTLWFTGLSGSGKTTLCRCLNQRLQHMNVRTELLDGDVLRNQLFQGLGFSKEDRSLNVRTAAYLAQIRQSIQPFVEIYVKCSFEECARRDVKGLYHKALSGEIPHFTGLTAPMRNRSGLSLLWDTEQHSEDQSTELILAYLIEHGYIY